MHYTVACFTVTNVDRIYVSLFAKLYSWPLFLGYARMGDTQNPRARLNWLCAHLRDVVAHSSSNRMSALALSVCLAPTFFPEPHKARDDLVSVQMWFSHAAAALRLMIEHHSEVFGQ